MRLMGLLVAVLVGFLLGWGGFVVPGTANAAPLHHVVMADDGALDDCTQQAGQQDDSDHQDHANPSHHQGCCVMAQCVSAVEPATAEMHAADWTPVAMPMRSAERLRGRYVAPLQRPPRAIA